MNRRTFLRAFGGLAGLPALGFLGDGSHNPPTGGRRAGDEPDPGPYRETPMQTMEFEPLEKSKDEWRKILTEEEFKILRDEGTERPNSSPLNEEKRDGTFICAGCYLPIFSSEDKFMSGTGWPSFTRPIAESHIETKRDWKLVLPRTEYHCARCGGHQGHVFDDGPPPTGKRYCNNGAALDFVPEGEDLPELRQ